MNIFLVEDDPRLSALIRRGLEEEQRTVSVAYDGRTGSSWPWRRPTT